MTPLALQAGRDCADRVIGVARALLATTEVIKVQDEEPVQLARLRQQMQALQAMKEKVQDAPDQQISLTDPDARSMATSGRGTGIVGYNVQTAVDAEHHLIVAHEVINVGHDRAQLEPMARKAHDAMGCEELTALADRGYFNGEQGAGVRGNRHFAVRSKNRVAPRARLVHPP